MFGSGATMTRSASYRMLTVRRGSPQEALERIAALYAIENRIRGRSAEEPRRWWKSSGLSSRPGWPPSRRRAPSRRRSALVSTSEEVASSVSSMTVASRWIPTVSSERCARSLNDRDRQASRHRPSGLSGRYRRQAPQWLAPSRSSTNSCHGLQSPLPFRGIS